VAYVNSILDDPPEAFPLNRLWEAVAGAQVGVRSRVREQTDTAVRTALHQTVFRFELVMRINVTTHDLIDRVVLVYTAIAGHLAMLANEPAKRRVADASHGERLAVSRDFTLRRVIELHAAQEARALAEARYLYRQPALFPDGVQAWNELVHEAERLAVMVDRFAELEGLSPAEVDLPDVIEARTAAILADLVEPAKITALEKLGEGERAIRIATAWVLQRASSRLDEMGKE